MPAIITSMTRLAILALCSLAAAIPPAAAQSGWYGGISVGQSRTSRDLVVNRECTITLGSDFDSDFDDKEGAFKGTLGYRLNRWIALEAGYADLGSHRVLTRFPGGDPPLPAAIDLTREITAAGADVVVFVPLGREAAVFARLGLVRTRLKARQALDGNVVFTGGDPSERVRSNVRNETTDHYGIGIEWAIDAQASMRLEWERYAGIGKAFAIGGSGTTGEADTDTLMVGVVLRF
jgi:opacity protein-like surface antigen